MNILLYYKKRIDSGCVYEAINWYLILGNNNNNNNNNNIFLPL